MREMCWLLLSEQSGRDFHFPFAILDLSFVIAATARRAAMANGIWQMENETCLALPQSEDNPCGNSRLYLPPAAPPIGKDHVVLKRSESDLICQPHVYSAAGRRERETRIVAPYLWAEDFAVRVDRGEPVQRMNKPRDVLASARKTRPDQKRKRIHVRSG